MDNRFTLADFRKQMAMIAKPGRMQKMADMMPGVMQLREAMDDFDGSELKGLSGIIDAMTPAERANSKLLDESRRARVAAGAGCTPHDVGELLHQYEAMAEVIDFMAGKSLKERMWYLNRREDRDLKRPPFPPDDENDTPPPDHPRPPLPT